MESNKGKEFKSTSTQTDEIDNLSLQDQESINQQEFVFPDVKSLTTQFESSDKKQNNITGEKQIHKTEFKKYGQDLAKIHTYTENDSSMSNPILGGDEWLPQISSDDCQDDIVLDSNNANQNPVGKDVLYQPQTTQILDNQDIEIHEDNQEPTTAKNECHSDNNFPPLPQHQRLTALKAPLLDSDNYNNHLSMQVAHIEESEPVIMPKLKHRNVQSLNSSDESDIEDRDNSRPSSDVDVENISRPASPNNSVIR